MKKSPKKPKKQDWSCRVLFEKILNGANVAWYRDKKFPWEKNNNVLEAQAHSYCQCAMKHCLRVCEMTLKIHAVKCVA